MGRSSKPHYQPSRQQIERECEEIRKTWDEAEKQRRRGFTCVNPQQPYTVPTVSVRRGSRKGVRGD